MSSSDLDNIWKQKYLESESILNKISQELINTKNMLVKIYHPEIPKSIPDLPNGFSILIINYQAYNLFYQFSIHILDPMFKE